MNLDELQSVQSKERRKDSLQHLRDSFYEEAGEYVAELVARRDAAAESADDPFSSPEVRRLTDEIETAKDVVQKVYDRRMGKIVKHASLVAAGMGHDDEGMTTEERDLFRNLVDTIETNKESVLDALAGKRASIDETRADAGASADDPVPDDGAGGVNAADLMGSGPDDAEAAPSEGARAQEEARGGNGPSPAADPSESVADASPPAEGRDAPSTSDDGPIDVPPESAPPGESHRSDESAPAPANDGPAAGGQTDESDDASPFDGLEERVTVRITADVGEILGVDDRSYELSEDDVVALPEQNADALVQRDGAERLG